jgi:hypothetical protein
MVTSKDLCRGHVIYVRWRECSGHEGRALAQGVRHRFPCLMLQVGSLNLDSTPPATLLIS